MFEKSACLGGFATGTIAQERDQQLLYVKFLQMTLSLDLSLYINHQRVQQQVDRKCENLPVCHDCIVYQCLQLKTAIEIFTHEESENYSLILSRNLNQDQKYCCNTFNY